MQIKERDYFAIVLFILQRMTNLGLIFIYIYIYVYIYTHTHTHTHTNIYIYNAIEVNLKYESRNLMLPAVSSSTQD